MAKHVFTLVLICLLTQVARSQSPWPAITKEMRPWTRWWWMGSAVDDRGLDSALTKYHQAGFGGVEITPIYGAVGFEPKYVPFLSPEWISRLSFTVKKAGSLGMGVDMNTGTGWPFGGPQITPGLAATRLVLRGDSVVSEGTGQKVKRAAPGGEGLVLDHYDSIAVHTYLDRFTKALGPKPSGVRAFFNDSYEVYGANWTRSFLNEFRRRKGYDLRPYLKELVTAPPSGATAAGTPPASLPALAADTITRVRSDYREVFSDLLLDNFTRQWVRWSHGRGAISKNQAHGSPANILDLYSAADIPECEAFFGLSKFDIPDLPHEDVDIRDKTEHDPIMFQFASSAAHVGNKPLASSETFVWLTEHFRTTLAECKPEVEKLWLAGINHVFFHGTTYSPPDIPWPGWIFYAASEFVPNNSIWPHLPALNEYIARCQSILQAGRADNQLWVYWPFEDVIANPKGMEIQLSMHNVDEWLYPTPFHALVQGLEKKGYSTDFVSDNMIRKLAASAHTRNDHPLLVPRCHFMPVSTFANLLNLARGGATVIFEALPEDAPGLGSLQKNRQQLRQLIGKLHFQYDRDSIGIIKYGSGRIIVGNPQHALGHAKVFRESLCDYGLKYIRRDIHGDKYYFIVNHTAKAIDEWIPLNVRPSSVMLMDPMNGHFGMTKASLDMGSDPLSFMPHHGDTLDFTNWTPAYSRMKVHLQLRPGESIILRTFRGFPPDTFPLWKYFDQPATPQTLPGPWSLQFTSGGPQLPAGRQVTTLDGWENLDSTSQAFSGTGVYTSTFECNDLSAGEYLLELKGVGASAHVWINDKDAGWIWSIPFSLRVKEYLHTGTNTIRIETANLMANRIRDMDRKGTPWRNYHEINFVSIQYKPFDAAHWQPLPSGLTGPVTITPYSTK